MVFGVELLTYYLINWWLVSTDLINWSDLTVIPLHTRHDCDTIYLLFIYLFDYTSNSRNQDELKTRRNPQFLDVGGKSQWERPMQSGRDWHLNPHARLWSEVGIEPGSTEVKGRDRYLCTTWSHSPMTSHLYYNHLGNPKHPVWIVCLIKYEKLISCIYNSNLQL